MRYDQILSAFGCDRKLELQATAVLVIISSIPICCSYQQIYLYLIFAQIVRVISMP